MRHIEDALLCCVWHCVPAGHQIHADRHLWSCLQVISQIFYVAKDLFTPATLHANAVGTSVHLKQVTKVQRTH